MKNKCVTSETVLERRRRKKNETRKTFHKIIWPCVLLWIVIDTERRRIFSSSFSLALSPTRSLSSSTQSQFQLMYFFCAFWMNILYARITWINVCQCSLVLAEFASIFEIHSKLDIFILVKAHRHTHTRSLVHTKMTFRKKNKHVHLCKMTCWEGGLKMVYQIT